MVSYNLSDEPDKDNFSTRQNCTATLLMGSLDEQKRTTTQAAGCTLLSYSHEPDPRGRWYEVVAVNGWSRPSSKRLL